MSGRFTPAAAVSIRTSPGPGLGTCRSTTANSSAPSGWGPTMAFIDAGTALLTAPRLLTERALGSNGSRMDLDDLFPSKPGDPLVELAKQDLDPMSIEELQERVESLKAEIARVEAHMNRAQAHRSAAEDLFKK